MEPRQPLAFLHRPIERLARAFAPERIMLFGSYAKGTAHPGSDADLLVVADFEGDPAAQLRRARQLVADCFPVVDVVFCTPEDVARAQVARSPFLLSVLESGVTVYQRTAARPSSAGERTGEPAMKTQLAAGLLSDVDDYSGS
jgi:predicted nucleotidyltransferase